MLIVNVCMRVTLLAQGYIAILYKSAGTIMSCRVEYASCIYKLKMSKIQDTSAGKIVPMLSPHKCSKKVHRQSVSCQVCVHTVLLSL